MQELIIAAAEQMKITELRLQQLWRRVQGAAASQASRQAEQAATADRRAGLVLSHVKGACTTLWHVGC